MVFVDFTSTKKFGNRSLKERLNLSHERKNLHEFYAIAAYKLLPGRLADSIIGHLPREISRPTRFFLLREGLLSLKS